MAKIIYKEGYEGQNKLSCIEGIEIDILTGQKALIYPQYAFLEILKNPGEWGAPEKTEIEALKVTDTYETTMDLRRHNSRAALWVTQFKSDKRGIFCLPSLAAVIEFRYQRKEIDALAKTIEGAHLLQDNYKNIWTCSRCDTDYCWATLDNELAFYWTMKQPLLVVPTILYREPYQDEYNKFDENLMIEHSAQRKIAEV